MAEWQQAQFLVAMTAKKQAHHQQADQLQLEYKASTEAMRRESGRTLPSLQTKLC